METEIVEQLPYSGLKVLDFSTLLPGPLATLYLAEMGAEVIKIENPDGGDPMRGYAPMFGSSGVNFAMLNRGKESLALDLKSPGDRSRLDPLLTRADVIVEQFRPGVMARLGLDYDTVSRVNPGIVYCSITGYGQTGPLAAVAGHDLNYMAETGILGLSGDEHGNPVLPPVLAADIAGGTYPAVMNIMAAIQCRNITGKGAHLDIAMAENLFPFAYWALGEGLGAGQWPDRSRAVVTGGSPRYGIYAAKDGQHIAVAALEDKFWSNLCDALGLPAEIRDDARAPQETRAILARRLASFTADELRELVCAADTCCSIVVSLKEAVGHPHFRGRSLFSRSVGAEGAGEMPALPVPIHRPFTRSAETLAAPELGNAGASVDSREKPD